MDQILEMAKELGEAIQQDERYIRVHMAQTAADEDEALQALIGEFNLQRMALANATEKEPHDDAELGKINEAIRDVYAKIMDNPSMVAYNAARQPFENLVNQVSRIIVLSSQGEDPYAEHEEGCTGSCSTCGGCH